MALFFPEQYLLKQDLVLLNLRQDGVSTLIHHLAVGVVKGQPDRGNNEIVGNGELVPDAGDGVPIHVGADAVEDHSKEREQVISVEVVREVPERVVDKGQLLFRSAHIPLIVGNTVRQIADRLLTAQPMAAGGQIRAGLFVDISCFRFGQGGGDALHGIRQLGQLLRAGVDVILNAQIKAVIDGVDEQAYTARGVDASHALPSVFVGGQEHIPRQGDDGKLLLQLVVRYQEDHIRLPRFCIDLPLLDHHCYGDGIFVDLGLFVDRHFLDLAGLIVVDIGPKGFGEKLGRGGGQRGGRVLVRLFHGGDQVLADIAPQAGAIDDGSQHQYQDDGQDDQSDLQTALFFRGILDFHRAPFLNVVWGTKTIRWDAASIRADISSVGVGFIHHDVLFGRDIRQGRRVSIRIIFTEYHHI